MDQIEMQEFNQLLGSFLAQFRKAKCLTQACVADAIDISVNYVSMIERGKVKIPAYVLFEYCRVIDIDPGVLYHIVREIRKDRSDISG